MSRSLAIKYVLGVALLTLCLVTANAAYAQASLAIGIQVTPTSETDAQGRITYAATVTNSGVGAANNLVVTFTMPYIELPISSNPGSCVFTYSGPLYATCPLGNVASGGTATASVVVYPTNVGNLFVTADAAESGGATATIQGGSTLTG